VIDSKGLRWPVVTPISMSKTIIWLKIGFESSTMVLTNVTTFGVALGTTVLAAKVEEVDGLQRQRYQYCVVALAHEFQNHKI
jgi:hypothetical protein